MAVLENVLGLLAKDNTTNLSNFDEAVRLLRSAGYMVIAFSLMASDFGVAQKRPRIWFCCLRMSFLNGLISVRKRFTLSEAVRQVRLQMELRMRRWSELCSPQPLENILLGDGTEPVQQMHRDLLDQTFGPKPAKMTHTWVDNLSGGFWPSESQVEVHPGYKALGARELDCVIDQQGLSAPSNLSQCKSRNVRFDEETTPTLTCKSEVWAPKKKRMLLGAEAMRLQCPLRPIQEGEMLEALSNVELIDLSGNVFNGATCAVFTLDIMMALAGIF